MKYNSCKDCVFSSGIQKLFCILCQDLLRNKKVCKDYIDKRK